MNIHGKAIWAGLILCAAAAVGCNKTESGEHFMGKPQGRTLVIHVRSDVTPDPSRQCSVDCKTVNVYASDHQKLRWVSDDGKKYTVDFEKGPGFPNPDPGTPFKDGQDKPKHTLSTADPELEPTGPQGYYYYSVKDANGYICLKPDDPGVHVNP